MLNDTLRDAKISVDFIHAVCIYIYLHIIYIYTYHYYGDHHETSPVHHDHLRASCVNELTRTARKALTVLVTPVMNEESLRMNEKHRETPNKHGFCLQTANKLETP